MNEVVIKEPNTPPDEYEPKEKEHQNVGSDSGRHVPPDVHEGEVIRPGQTPPGGVPQPIR